MRDGKVQTMHDENDHTTHETSRTPSRFSLAGRAVLVTGAGRGLGRECALALGEAGAEIWAMARSGDELDGLCAELKRRGAHGHALVCDVTNGQGVRDQLARIPRLDVLVNNAGMNIPEPFVDVTEAHLDRILGLNVRAAFLVSQAAVRRMLDEPQRKARGGVVIHMSSQMGHVGAVNRTAYCMSKHAIEGLTKAMAVELAQHNIRVVSVAPTFIDTPMTKPMFARPGFSDWVLDRIPLGRLGQMEEVASAVVYLASSGAALVTGSSLLLDGGWTAQ